MTLDEVIREASYVSLWLSQLRSADDVLDPTDRINVWLVVDDLAAELALTLRDLLNDATLALVDLDIEPGETFHAGHDVVVMGRRSVGSDKWAGWALCGALAQQLVDPETGEQIRAVPLDVMRSTVAGCADDALTSSKWRVTALRQLVDVERYHLEQPISQSVIRRERGRV